MRESIRSLTLRDAQQTQRLGETLAGALPDLSRGPLVMHLLGELGAGKTTLVRGFARRLGITETIRSPTYTLVEIHETASLCVVHVDLYRVRSAQEVEALALGEYLAPRHVLLIEWPQQGAGFTPAADVSLHLEYQGTGRQASIAGITALGCALAGAVQ